MANRYFGNFADVWKHLLLVEVLACSRPKRYAETHAGSAAYSLVPSPEREFGIGHFLRTAGQVPGLVESPYMAHLNAFSGLEGERYYPGSPLLAMLEIQRECT